LLYDELVSVAEFLAARGVRLVLVTPPYFERYNAAFEARLPDVLGAFRAAMRGLATEHGIEHRDYGGDPRWSRDARNFVDSDHLNDCGKRSFLRALVDETAPIPAERAVRDHSATVAEHVTLRPRSATLR